MMKLLRKTILTTIIGLLSSTSLSYAQSIPPLEINEHGDISAPSTTVPLLPLRGQTQNPVISSPAPNDPPMGMHNMKVSNQPEPSTQDRAADQIKEASPLSTPVDPDVATTIPPKTYTPLSPSQALIAPDKLRVWGNLTATATATTKNDAINIIKAIEADRGAVPPQGLFLAAHALATQGMMDEACVYYFVGQLRLTFDALRWPPYAPDNQHKEKDLEQHKTPDQKSPNTNRASNIKLVNPHAGASTLASNFGQPILKWALKHPERMKKNLAAAAAWDMSAPFAYDPGYSVGPPIPYADWATTLETTRTNYFQTMMALPKQIR